ncbi:MAG: 50S ribosomal protein L15 [Phycisphaerae bacterium]|nr:50S ribosomal protein L15 [Phycisphaerae bacterium]
MMIHEITALAGANRKPTRVGRGESSGLGKTSGKGHKGARARAGYSLKKAFEGGQTPYFRRISKRGFSNFKYRTEFWIVNLGDVLAHEDFAKGGVVNAERLIKAGLIRDTTRPLKVLGDLGEAAKGGVKVKLEITAERVTAKVRELVTKAGGSVTEAGTRRDEIRGIDRNSDDQTPKNLTRKLKRGKRKTTGKTEGAAATDGVGQAAEPAAEKSKKKDGKAAKPEAAGGEG